MNSPPRILVGVCTYNEVVNVDPMVDRLRRALPEADILVVDDNSPDGTADAVRSIAASDDQVQLIVRTDERGLGGAIVRAMTAAVDGDYDLFVNLDGDLSHDPAQIPSLIQAAISDPTIDVVVGSRYIPGGQIVGWPLRRRIMSRFVNRFATSCLRLPINDCSGSMRCYRVATLRQLDLQTLQCTGYALLEELLVRVHRDGGKLAEVPITFTERQDGHSKLTLGEAIRSMSFMVRLAVRVPKK
ncbi:MAG: polyprenol monophosphomannose synthase [Pirellulaceae bacterium]|nr:polyprenol monophosphomannose synthase [Pirellulaceae bacterium]